MRSESLGEGTMSEELHLGCFRLMTSISFLPIQAFLFLMFESFLLISCSIKLNSV